jgi:hypothetical protein
MMTGNSSVLREFNAQQTPMQGKLNGLMFQHVYTTH